jgi:hypothetical protein
VPVVDAVVVAVVDDEAALKAIAAYTNIAFAPALPARI